MSEAPDSVTAAKLIRDLLAAHEDAYSRGLNPLGLLDALHKRGWAIVRRPEFIGPMGAEFEEVETRAAFGAGENREDSP